MDVPSLIHHRLAVFVFSLFARRKRRNFAENGKWTCCAALLVEKHAETCTHCRVQAHSLARSQHGSEMADECTRSLIHTHTHTAHTYSFTHSHRHTRTPTLTQSENENVLFRFHHDVHAMVTIPGAVRVPGEDAVVAGSVPLAIEQGQLHHA